MATDPSWSTKTIGEYKSAAKARLDIIRNNGGRLWELLSTLPEKKQVLWLTGQVVINDKAVDRVELTDEKLVTNWLAEHSQS